VASEFVRPLTQIEEKEHRDANDQRMTAADVVGQARDSPVQEFVREAVQM
jgi:hypothetical protein